jgi:hypothetical protein
VGTDEPCRGNPPLPMPSILMIINKKSEEYLQKMEFGMISTKMITEFPEARSFCF